MADTDSLAQQALTVIASSRAHAERAPGPHISVFLTKDQADALIAELRGLRSQLAGKDATVAHEDRSADEALRRLRTLSSSACPGCKGTHYKDIDTVAAEIASLRSQLAESQRENAELRGIAARCCNTLGTGDHEAAIDAAASWLWGRIAQDLS